MTLNFTGYIEGYYGRLLDWRDRNRLLGGVAAAAMTSYFYAPKEDAFIGNFGASPMTRRGKLNLPNLPPPQRPRIFT